MPQTNKIIYEDSVCLSCDSTYKTTAESDVMWVDEAGQQMATDIMGQPRAPAPSLQAHRN